MFKLIALFGIILACTTFTFAEYMFPDRPGTTSGYNCPESDREYISQVQWICRSTCISTPNLPPSTYSDMCANSDEGCLMTAYYFWLAAGQCIGFGH
jgi:hypothetical protein